MDFQILVNAIIVKDGEILLSKRALTEKHAPGKWTIPGGKLEFNNEYEALESAARREVMEEVGIEIDNLELLVNNTFQHTEDGVKMLAVIFLCKYKSGEACPLEDTTDVKWVRENQLEGFDFNHENVKGYVKKAFNKIKKVQFGSYAE